MAISWRTFCGKGWSRLRLDRLARAGHLMSSEWRALAVATILLPIVALSIRFAGWTVTLERLRRGAKSARRPETMGMDPASLARVVRLAASHGPFRATCLPRAAVLWALLRRDGYDPAVAFGVRKAAGGVDAHAWVLLDGIRFDDVIGGAPFEELQHRGPVPQQRLDAAESQSRS